MSYEAERKKEGKKKNSNGDDLPSTGAGKHCGESKLRERRGRRKERWKEGGRVVLKETYGAALTGSGGVKRWETKRETGLKGENGCWTHRWQRSPLMPLVVQKHLPLLGLHMPAWPLHLQAGKQTNKQTNDVILIVLTCQPDYCTSLHVKRCCGVHNNHVITIVTYNPNHCPFSHSRWQLPPLVGSP